MNVHIIGIAGKATSALAHMFLKKGWNVSGSDINVYPPNSTYLEKIGVKISSPYNADNLKPGTDLVVVGGNALIVDPHNPEFEKAKVLHIKTVSYPEVLGEYVVKDESIVVAGNFGKGTISGAIVHVLSQLHQDPSYMVGGQMVGYEESLVSSQGKWSVVEGDEYPVPPITSEPPQSKFFYYKPKYLVLTSAEWDHYDQFPTEDLYIKNYIELVSKLPSDGVLIANVDGKNIKDAISHAPCKVVTYSHDGSSDIKTIDLNWTPTMLGEFNKDNLTAAYTLLTEIGFDSVQVKAHLESYAGLKQRMEVIYDDAGTVIVRDLAHSPVKAQTVLLSIKQKWPDSTVVGVFDMFSSSLKNPAVLTEFDNRFSAADKLYIPKVSAKKDADYKVTGKDIVAAISKTHEHTMYAPQQDVLIFKLISEPLPCVYVLMSSGGMDGLDERLIDRLKHAKATRAMRERLGEYINFTVNEKNIKIPYVINQKRFNIKRSAGKGSPEVIRHELLEMAQENEFDLETHSDAEVFRFMKQQQIGIECSGMVFHVLNAYLLTREIPSLTKLITPTSLFGRIRKSLMPDRWYRNVSADMLTNDKHTVPISDINDIQESDMIRMGVARPGDHVLIITGITRKNGVITEIEYAHSSYKRTVRQGPHTAIIKVVDAKKSLQEQQWQEKTPQGEAYSVHFHPERGDGVRRLKILNTT